MSDAVEYRRLPDFRGYRIGSDRSVWSQRAGIRWRRLKVCDFPGMGPAVRVHVGGRYHRIGVDELMRMAFSIGSDVPPDLPCGVTFHPVPGFPGYGVGSDRSVWSRHHVGGPFRRPHLAEARPWRRLETWRSDEDAPRVSLKRDGRRYWLSLEAVMHAAIGTSADESPPEGVELRPVPGFLGCEAGSDFSLWGRPPASDYEVLGMAPPRRRLVASIGRTGMPALRLDVGGRRVEVPVTQLIRAAFTVEELCPRMPPALAPPAADLAAEPPVSAVASGGRPAGVEYRPVEGFPGYEVGADCSVWSCIRRDGQGLAAPGEPVVWRRRAVQVSKTGRACLVLWRDGKGHWVSVAEIRKAAFAPLLPTGRPGDESQVRGSANGCARLTEEKVLEARRLKRQGWTYPALAERYNVGKVTLFYAISGRTWSHVPMETRWTPLPCPALEEVEIPGKPGIFSREPVAKGAAVP